jgi:hypothetical protein
MTFCYFRSRLACVRNTRFHRMNPIDYTDYVLKEPSIRSIRRLNLSREFPRFDIYIYRSKEDERVLYLWIVVIKELLISSLKLCRHLSPGDKRERD